MKKINMPIKEENGFIKELSDQEQYKLNGGCLFKFGLIKCFTWKRVGVPCPTLFVVPGSGWVEM